jgi:Domain of unknown function (DUF5668)
VAGGFQTSYIDDVRKIEERWMGMEINHHSKGHLVSGLFLIGLGVLFLLDRLNVVLFAHVARDFWPVILIVLGVARLMGGSCRTRRIGDQQ